MKRNTLHISQLVIFALFLIGFSACNDDDTIQEPEVKNRIEAIDFANEVRYKFEYFNKFTLIQPQVLMDGNYQDAGNGLEITNFDNIIEIRFSTGRGVQGRLFVKALVENEKIVEVQRAFESGSTYTYKLEYTPNNIRIVLEFDADGALLNSEAAIIEFGDYKLDENGNVIEVLKYRNFDSPPTELDLYERSTLSYDNANNNWKDMLLFFFGWQTLPDIRFFSENNILIIEQDLIDEDPKIYQFQYIYDDSGRTIKAFEQWLPLNPDGVTESFIYEDQ